MSRRDMRKVTCFAGIQCKTGQFQLPFSNTDAERAFESRNFAGALLLMWVPMWATVHNFRSGGKMNTDWLATIIHYTH